MSSAIEEVNKKGECEKIEIDVRKKERRKYGEK